MRIERLTERYELRVEWVHFPLHPETPAEGRSLAELSAGRELDLATLPRLRRIDSYSDT